MIDTGTWIGLFFALCSTGIVLALLIPDRRNPQWLAWIGSLASLVLLWASGQALFAGRAWGMPSNATKRWASI